MKFSGLVRLGTHFLEDWGTGHSGSEITNAPEYPVAVAVNLINLATHIKSPFVVPQGAIVSFDVMKNGVAVPGYSITYVPGEGSVKTLLAGPVPYAIGERLDIRVVITGISSGQGVNVSATVGVLP